VDVKQRWRDYRTAGGARPVADFITGRSLLDRVEIVAAMKDVRTNGVRAAARHLRGPLFEPRANGLDESYRLIFAQEGRRGRILLALVVISKKSQKTPGADLRLAERPPAPGGAASLTGAPARGAIERFATAVGRRIEYRLATKPRRGVAALARE